MSHQRLAQGVVHDYRVAVCAAQRLDQYLIHQSEALQALGGQIQCIGGDFFLVGALPQN